MYAGHLVEAGPTEDVLAAPKHPYTRLLVSAAPDPRAELVADPELAAGEPPKVIDPRPGCRFRGRCPLAIPDCGADDPPLRELALNHRAACIVADTARDPAAGAYVGADAYFGADTSRGHPAGRPEVR
jgi:peptide/nickel transport system ATP-binding protein